MRLVNPTNPYIKPGTNVLMIPLEEMDLTIRSYTCLRRAGNRRVADLLNYISPEEIEGIRNLGKKCRTEIARILRSFGIEDTAWDTFLSEET